MEIPSGTLGLLPKFFVSLRKGFIKSTRLHYCSDPSLPKIFQINPAVLGAFKITLASVKGPPLGYTQYSSEGWTLWIEQELTTYKFCTLSPKVLLMFSTRFGILFLYLFPLYFMQQKVGATGCSLQGYWLSVQRTLWVSFGGLYTMMRIKPS